MNLNTTTHIFDYQILHLTDAFYSAYPNPPYTEILKKTARSYNCLLIQTHYDFFICIPYRSEITHKYSYIFKKSNRSKCHKSGLDYTKIVIIKNSDYISNTDSVIDQDEYVETRNNISKIKKASQEYVESYMKHINHEKRLDAEEFLRRYQYSPLKYFHEELGLYK